MTARVHPRDIASPEPRIAVSHQGTTSIILVQGDCDPAAENRMRQAVAEVFRTHPESLVLDLSGAISIQSSGIDLVAALARRCTCQGVRLVIVPGPAQVQRLFRTSGLSLPLPFVGGR